MHHIIKKAAVRASVTFGSVGSNHRLCVVCEDHWSETGRLTVHTMLNV